MCCANPARCLNWCLALTEAVVEALKTVLERARPGAGHRGWMPWWSWLNGDGACQLGALTGHPALDAAAWALSSYCTKAAETPGQEAFIAVPLTRGLGRGRVCVVPGAGLTYDQRLAPAPLQLVNRVQM
jgi:hypothetical protein